MILSILLVLITRGAVIFTGSADSGGIDLAIYREVGELVANDVDPYDPKSNPSRREALRQNRNGIFPEIISKGAYDFYVAGNLPGSTAFYGIIEAIYPESVRWWRSALSFGDVLILLAAFFLLTRAGVHMDTFRNQLAFALSTVWCPSLFYWGTIMSEDKQYQTALMLLLAGCLIAPLKRGYAATLLIAVVGFLSVIFKAVGVFLAPLVLQYLRSRPMRETIVAVILVGLLTAVLLYSFESAFVLLARRTRDGSSSLAIGHGSPWRLLPIGIVLYVRPVVCACLIFAVGASYYLRKIDLVNACAAGLVIFLCLWVVSGSMDRMNIAMIFATMCIATLSVARWQRLIEINFVVQLLIYACVVARLRDPQWLFATEIPDSVATAIFVISYFTLLLCSPKSVDVEYHSPKSSG